MRRSLYLPGAELHHNSDADVTMTIRLSPTGSYDSPDCKYSRRIVVFQKTVHALLSVTCFPGFICRKLI
jgi:hypothetical protein